MRDELAVETIENSFQVEQNHPMIQQRQSFKYNFFSTQHMERASRGKPP
ncbi:hypothetical protein H6G35_30090 [Aulosira sp. FACHB-113]|nr:hypothetical protein [Aulosira sp. FACHB-113]